MRLFGRSVVIGLGIGLGLLVLGAAAWCGVGVANNAAAQPSRTATAAAAKETARVDTINRQVEATYAPTRDALSTRLTTVRAESDAWLQNYQATLTAQPR